MKGAWGENFDGFDGAGREPRLLTLQQRMKLKPFRWESLDHSNPFNIYPKDLPDWSELEWRKLLQSPGPDQPIEEAVRPYRKLLRFMGYRVLEGLARWEYSCAMQRTEEDVGLIPELITHNLGSLRDFPKYILTLPPCWLKGLIGLWKPLRNDKRLLNRIRRETAAFGCYRGILVLQFKTTDWIDEEARNRIVIAYLNVYGRVSPPYYMHPSRMKPR